MLKEHQRWFRKHKMRIGHWQQPRQMPLVGNALQVCAVDLIMASSVSAGAIEPRSEYASTAAL